MPRVEIVAHVERLVSAFSKEEANIFSDLNRYKDIMNDFLEDSAKEVDLSDSGEIVIRTNSGRTIELPQLSSGVRSQPKCTGPCP